MHEIVREDASAHQHEALTAALDRQTAELVPILEDHIHARGAGDEVTRRVLEYCLGVEKELQGKSQAEEAGGFIPTPERKAQPVSEEELSERFTRTFAILPKTCAALFSSHVFPRRLRILSKFSHRSYIFRVAPSHPSNFLEKKTCWENNGAPTFFDKFHMHFCKFSISVSRNPARPSRKLKMR